MLKIAISADSDDIVKIAKAAFWFAIAIGAISL